MALTSAEIVVLRKPEYAGKSDLTNMIAYAETQLSEDVYGDQYANAVALLTLHYFAKQSPSASNAPGSVTSETEGRLSRSFDSSSGSPYPMDWSTTTWGQELIQKTLSRVFMPTNRMIPNHG